MLIGIDDTDSPAGMCTTYLAAIICREFETIEKPRLIRLNPNIPYRTRGNGAIALRIKDSRNAKERITELVKKHSHIKEQNTNPGLVFIEDEENLDLTPLHDLYRKAVSKHVTIQEAERTAKIVQAELTKFKNGRGIIGALAAIGADLSSDCTYELIAYRSPENYNTKRSIDVDSVFKMNERMYPKVFDSIDPEKKTILITPNGLDPVFCGIRGETEEYVKKAWTMIRPLEDIELTQVFQTNQATDAHTSYKPVVDVNPFDCVILEGAVDSNPETVPGGHVIFTLKDATGKIACAAYKPTGRFRSVVKMLIKGDVLRVYGGVSKYPKTLNLEKIRLISPANDYLVKPPACCGRLMTSAGRNKGYKCRKCGSRKSYESAESKIKPRKIGEGFYEVPPRARRHLSKPLVRYSTSLSTVF
jgi:tRNA(Ile2)-agmatinylcytidine synthase